MASHYRLLIRRIGGPEIKAEIGQIFPLDQAAAAHCALEARVTIGSTTLLT